MKKYLFIFLPIFLFGKLEIVTTYGYISAITKEIGGDEVEITTLASSESDPHLITPKPSFISKLRNADLLIKNGAELEDSWLMPLQRRSGNREIIIGGKGYLNLSKRVDLIDVHSDSSELSRKNGDVHAHGNPHFHLSPTNIDKIAEAILKKLIELDDKNSDKYNSNYLNFISKWQKFKIELANKMNEFKKLKTVSYHRVYDYFLRYFEIELIATIEPIAGVSPSMGDISNLLIKIKNEKINLIMTDLYHSKDGAEFLSKESGIPYKIVPHDVNFANGENIFDLFNHISEAFVLIKTK